MVFLGLYVLVVGITSLVEVMHPQLHKRKSKKDFMGVRDINVNLEQSPDKHLQEARNISVVDGSPQLLGAITLGVSVSGTQDIMPQPQNSLPTEIPSIPSSPSSIHSLLL